MTTSIRILVSVITLLMVTFSLPAQNVEGEEPRTRIAVEIDPATFAFNGYSAHLRIQPKSSTQLLFGPGIYAMDMPDLIININENNKDKGWEVRLNQGLGVFAEYHFTEVNNKWFVGAQASMQEYKIENTSYNGNQKFTNALLMGYGGYSIQPFDFPVYFKAWGGLGYTSKISGSPMLGEQEYDIAPISMFATLHLGYIF
jgi:hypothetical protein